MRLGLGFGLGLGLGFGLGIVRRSTSMSVRPSAWLSMRMPSSALMGSQPLIVAKRSPWRTAPELAAARPAVRWSTYTCGALSAASAAPAVEVAAEAEAEAEAEGAGRQARWMPGWGQG